MKRRWLSALAAGLLLWLCVFSGAHALVERSPLLDAAFSALEKGNLFLRRYNEITGANVEPLYELGVPYYFGGKANALFWARYPEYGKSTPWDESDYFKMDRKYIYGFDCSGFTQWVNRQSGRKSHDTLKNMMEKWDYQADGNHVFSHYPGHEMPPWDEISAYLEVGDLFVVKHESGRFRHIMMYIGTLSDYGFTAEEAPGLAAYLHYPLVIHCGGSPVYGERFQQFIDENPDRYGDCTTTDGGVQVSILGVPLEQTPYHAHVQFADYDYFLLDEGRLVMTALNVFDLSSYCWFRM